MSIRWITGLYAFIFSVMIVSLLARNSNESPHGKLAWDCQSCHTAEGWDKLRDNLDFDHADTGFPLIGAHESNDCMSCHNNLQFSAIGVACADCHTDVHRGQLSIDCESCHVPVSWEDRQDVFQEHAGRGFPLTGVHAIVDCQACHIGDQQVEFAGISADCQSCHVSDFQATTNPAHPAANFSLDCESCHRQSTITWQGAEFDHDAIFQLNGQHSTLDCNSCHQQTFVATPNTCNGCHNQDFQQVSDPNHVAASFSTNCLDCHGENAWQPATFDHNNTGFALLGAHIGQDCASCHVNGQFAGTLTDCNSCHNDDYVSVTDPNHVTGNFSLACEACHGTSAWTPANWDHDNQYFPIYSGKHKEAWNDCIDCHVNTGNFAVFECIFCHEHRKTKMDNDHDEVTGYVYQSTACLNCHPDGDSKALNHPFLDRTRK